MLYDTKNVEYMNKDCVTTESLDCSDSSYCHLFDMAGRTFMQHLALCSLFLLCLSSLIAAAHEPKAAWVRGGRRKLAQSSQLSNRLVKQYVNGSCSSVGPADFKAPKANVWSGLTDIEAANVTRWLFESSGLNLTNSSLAGSWDNTLLLVELNIPNKTDVVSYIDGNGAPPERWAHVLLDIRATKEPTYSDILVGPLPIDNVTTTWRPLEYQYTRKTGGTIRNLEADYDSVVNMLYNISSSISDITLDLWNGTALGLDNDTLDVWGIDPVWQMVRVVDHFILEFHRARCNSDT